MVAMDSFWEWSGEKIFYSEKTNTSSAKIPWEDQDIPRQAAFP